VFLSKDFGSGFSTAYTSCFSLLTAARGPSAAYRPKWSVGCLQGPRSFFTYKCPGPVGCLQLPRVSSGRARVLLTVRRLLTSSGRAEPAAAYSPTAAYKHGPGWAGRCLQSNRCLQAWAGPSRPLLTVQPLLTSPGRAEPAAAYRAAAAYKLTLASSCRPLLGERAHPSGAGTFLQTTATPAVCSACPASHSACNGTEHDAWITGAPGALARLERAG
jgi:hypothetical protein